MKTLKEIRTEMVEEIVAIVRKAGGEIYISDIDEGTSPILQDDVRDGNNTYFLDKVEVTEDGLSLDGSSAYANFSWTGNNLPIEALEGVLVFLKEHEEELNKPQNRKNPIKARILAQLNGYPDVGRQVPLRKHYYHWDGREFDSVLLHGKGHRLRLFNGPMFKKTKDPKWTMTVESLPVHELYDILSDVRLWCGTLLTDMAVREPASLDLPDTVTLLLRHLDAFSLSGRLKRDIVEEAVCDVVNDIENGDYAFDYEANPTTPFPFILRMDSFQGYCVDDAVNLTGVRVGAGSCGGKAVLTLLSSGEEVCSVVPDANGMMTLRSAQTWMPDESLWFLEEWLNFFKNNGTKIK